HDPERPLRGRAPAFAAALPGGLRGGPDRLSTVDVLPRARPPVSEPLVKPAEVIAVAQGVELLAVQFGGHGGRPAIGGPLEPEDGPFGVAPRQLITTRGVEAVVTSCQAGGLGEERGGV